MLRTVVAMLIHHASTIAGMLRQKLDCFDDAAMTCFTDVAVFDDSHGCFDDGAMACFNGPSDAVTVARLLRLCCNCGRSGVKDVVCKATLTP